jgi:hypothetical protein
VKSLIFLQDNAGFCENHNSEPVCTSFEITSSDSRGYLCNQRLFPSQASSKVLGKALWLALAVTFSDLLHCPVPRRSPCFRFSPLLQISNHVHLLMARLSSQVDMFSWLYCPIMVGAMANGIENRRALTGLQRQNLRSLDAHRAYHSHQVDSAYHTRETIPLLDQIYEKSVGQEHEKEKE